MYIPESLMDSISVNHFRNNIKAFVERAVRSHTPLKVTRRSSASFVVMSADDWEREQETIYILENNSLIQQMAASAHTHSQGEGDIPEQAEIDAITRL